MKFVLCLVFDLANASGTLIRGRFAAGVSVNCCMLGVGSVPVPASAGVCACAGAGTGGAFFLFKPKYFVRADVRRPIDGEGRKPLLPL